MGSESSDDPAGSKKTFGDVWVARFDNPDGESGITLTTVNASLARKSSTKAHPPRTCLECSTTRQLSRPTAPAAVATATFISLGRDSPAGRYRTSTSRA